MAVYPYIFLDPGGTQPLGLIAIVAPATGVTYAHHCGGYATESRQLEGFAVPVGDATVALPLRAFFAQRFHGTTRLEACGTQKRDQMADGRLAIYSSSICYSGALPCGRPIHKAVVWMTSVRFSTWIADG